MQDKEAVDNDQLLHSMTILFVDLDSGLSSNGECSKKWKRFHRFHPTFPECSDWLIQCFAYLSGCWLVAT